MATGSLEILLRINDRAFNSALNGVSKNIQGVSKSFAGWNNALRIATQTFSNLTSQVTKAIGEFDQQVRAETKLNQILEATGESAGFTYDQLRNMSEELQDLTTFADRAAIEGMSRLAFFTQISGERFERATRLAADLSTFLGSSFQTEALRLGRALNDTASGIDLMTQAGISFTKSQKDTIKELDAAGRKIEAQEYLLTLLEDRVGGTATAMKDAASGPMRQLTNQVTDFYEEAGRAVAEGLEPFVKELINLFEEMEKDEELMNEIRELFATIASDGAETVRTIRELTGTFNDLVWGIQQFVRYNPNLIVTRWANSLFNAKEATEELNKEQKELRRSTREVNEEQIKSLKLRAEEFKAFVKTRENVAKQASKRMESLRREAVFEEDPERQGQIRSQRAQFATRMRAAVEVLNRAHQVAMIQQNTALARRIREEFNMRAKAELEFQEYSMALWDREQKRRQKEEQEAFEKRKALEEEIQDFRLSLRSPSEIMRDELQKIFGWVRSGNLSRSDAMKWVRQQREELQAGSDRGFVASFEGLQDLNRRIQAAAAGDNPVLAENRKQTKELEKQNTLLTRMEKQLKRPDVARTS